MKKNILFLSISTYVMGLIIPWAFTISFLDGNTIIGDIFINNIKQLNNNQLFFKILKNNLTVVVINIVGGLTFGLLTFLNTFYNGFILGFVIRNSLISYSPKFVFLSFAPHSAELIGIVLSTYIGYSLSFILYKLIFSNTNEFPQNSKKIINVTFLTFSIVLTAAFIEAYVTVKQ